MNRVSANPRTQQMMPHRNEVATYQKDAQGNYHFYATSGDDEIRVLNRGDRVVVRVNDQELYLSKQEARNMTIHGKAGDDRIHLDPGLPSGIRVACGAGDDSVRSRAHGARIYGGSGNDRIAVANSPAVINGGSGDDVVTRVRPRRRGRSGDRHTSGASRRGRSRRGHADHTRHGHGARHASRRGQRGRARRSGPGHIGQGTVINTGSGDDTVYLSGRGNTIETGAGNDTVHVSGYGNKVDTGAGNDNVRVRGRRNDVDTGAGNDKVRVRGRGNKVESGTGDDTVRVWGRRNWVDTGAGNDRVYVGRGRGRRSRGPSWLRLIRSSLRKALGM